MKRFLAAIALPLSATAAFAGGYEAPVVAAEPVVVTETTPVVESNWTGYYAGLQYGVGDSKGEAAAGSFGFDNLGVTANGPDYDAFGFHAGYTRDLGQFVLGGEFDYNKIDADSFNLAGYSIGDSEGDLVRLRGRAGLDMGKFQPYVTLGLAYLDMDSFDDTGITYGLGVEYLVNDQFSVGAEYSRNSFGDIDLGGIEGDLDSDLFQVRASYRF